MFITHYIFPIQRPTNSQCLYKVLQNHTLHEFKYLKLIETKDLSQLCSNQMGKDIKYTF